MLMFVRQRFGSKRNDFDQEMSEVSIFNPLHVSILKRLFWAFDESSLPIKNGCYDFTTHNIIQLLFL